MASTRHGKSTHSDGPAGLPELTHERIRILKDFGLLMACAFAIFGAIMLWRHKFLAPYFVTAAFIFTVVAYFRPQALNRFEVLWLKFGERISVVATFIILTLTFYCAVTPVGLLLRLFGKDLLKLKSDPEASTYWIPVPADSPGTRPYKPY